MVWKWPGIRPHKASAGGSGVLLICLLSGATPVAAEVAVVESAVANRQAALSNTHTETSPDFDAGTHMRHPYRALPLSFEANRGQVHDQVKFFSRGNGYSLFLTAAEAVLAWHPSSSRPIAQPGENEYAQPQETNSKVAHNTRGGVVRMQLLGTDSLQQIQGEEKLPGKSHYLVGKKRDKWLTDIPHYSKVRYRAVYPGIDLIYYWNQHQLEYDFIVAPGSDPGAIQLTFEGADRLSLDEAGNLVLDVAGRELVQLAPAVYQDIDGRRREVPARYVLTGRNRIVFEVDAYDARRSLVIDPVLRYSSYLGGSSRDAGLSLAVDHNGDSYITGFTESMDFPIAKSFQPASNGEEDAFVAKLNSRGDTLVYSTFLGGSGQDQGQAIAVDHKGNAYLTGLTASPDFPILDPLQPAGGGSLDAFVAKLNSRGDMLIYSTYLGGSDNDFGQAIAVDQRRNSYVTGLTASTDFPTVSAMQPYSGGEEDAFVAKLNATGDTLVYSTYLGGRTRDQGLGIAVDRRGQAYVTGDTSSGDFPTADPLQPVSGGGFDAFVAKLNKWGDRLVYATYLGGRFSDAGLDIALDQKGRAYLVGDTFSVDFPTVKPLQLVNGGGRDAFVAKLNKWGDALVYSTYLGGSESDGGRGIAVDRRGNVSITGFTRSTDFPVFNALQPTNGGGFADAFVAKLNKWGDAPVFSTYLGGSNNDVGLGIGLDHRGNACVTGFAGFDFPTVKPLQPVFGGAMDAFVAKITD